MFEWMNRHKKDIMTYTLWLVIPSFIVLYGYGECQKPQRMQWVVRVNGESITEYEWSQTMDNIQERMRQYGQDVERGELRAQALEASITLALNRQKAKDLGVHTIDAEVSQAIREMPYFKDQAGNFNINIYRGLLQRVDRNPIQFEEEQRDAITRSKLQAVVANTLFPAGNEVKRIEQRDEQKIQMEYLAFEPSRYVDDVSPAAEAMQKFFEDRREDYQIADQRRVSYARFYPSAYIDQATFSEYQLNRFFEENLESYRIPDSVRVEYLTYRDQDFTNQAQASEEEIQNYFEEHKSSFSHPPQVQVKFIVQPLVEMIAKQIATDEEIQDYYDKNIQRFTHEEQAKARHILLQVTSETTPEAEEAIKNRLLEIRKEIADGLSFEEAAKNYSACPSAEKGGDLGYIGRGQMVPPFEKAAFELPLGQISEPIQTQFGYHLILVENRREKGVEPLDQVREDVSKAVREQKALTAFRDEMEKLSSLDALSGQYEIKTTEWFSRGANLPGLTPGESSMIGSAAFRSDPSKKVFTIGYPGMENVFAVETIGRTESQPKTLEEAHDEVAQSVKRVKAAEIALAAAQADMDRIASASLTLDAIATERGFKVETSDFFSREDSFVRGFGARPSELFSTAFTLKQGEIGGPLKTQMGHHIIRLSAIEPEHVPELAEVQEQVERDCLHEKSEQLARLEARKFADSLFNQQISLEVGAASDQVEWGTTGLFTIQDPLPGIGQQSSVNYAAFQIEKVGEISEPVPVAAQSRSMNPQEKQNIEAFYILQLQEIKESYLPELPEVKEKVDNDYRLLLAEELAERHANEALEAIRQAIAAGQPVTPTQAIELKQFEDPNSQKTTGKGAVYRGPSEIAGNGMVSGIAGRAWPFTKTALALEPGQISGIVKCYREKRMKEGEVVQGPMLGAYILQVLGKKPASEAAPSSPNMVREQLQRRLQSIAFEAWVNEVSANAKIEYNQRILAPEEEEEESLQDESQPEAASSTGE